MINMDMQALIREFGQSLELPDLVLDEAGYCTLAFDEKWLINLHYDESLQRLTLFSHVSETIPEHRLKVYERLLSANHFWRETGGATLSTDSETGGVVLAQRSNGCDLDLPAFEDLIEAFVDNVAYWSREVELLQQPDGESSMGSLPFFEGPSSSFQRV